MDLTLCQTHTVTNMRKALGDKNIDGNHGMDLPNFSDGRMVQMLLHQTHTLAKVQTTQDLMIDLAGMTGIIF